MEIYAIRVLIESNDQPGGVDAQGGSADVRLTGTRDVKGGDGAVASPHEAGRPYITKVLARDHACRVNYAGEVRAHPGIERHKGAVRRPHEAVEIERRVSVGSCDHATVVDSDGFGENRARRVERGEAAVPSAQEAVTRDRVTVFSCDHPGRVNAGAVGTVYVVRDIERGDRYRREPERSRAPCHLRRCSFR